MMNLRGETCNATTPLPLGADVRRLSEAAQSLLAPDGLNRLLELLQEPRAIALLERRRAACPLSGLTQVRQQLACRKGVTDVVLRKRPAARAHDSSASFETAARKRNVGSDDDVVGLDLLDDPVVSCVERTADDLEHDARIVRNSHPGVGHESHIQAVSASDSVHLFLDRARVCIDIDVQQ